MKARVFVSFKTTVLDPQGQTVQSALNGLGYHGVAGVRQGKYFEIALSDGLSPEEARRQIDAMARDVLANPVIEEYRFEIIE
ncbi:MAG: phosphoribosylformylglycinamidine synthase subunit PurS [Candidatus Solibacter usitatus]|nr:phosphoribosylformylglycinamidine synthase subunit PurS [Candidatus Solibacter usitatus]